MQKGPICPLLLAAVFLPVATAQVFLVATDGPNPGNLYQVRVSDGAPTLVGPLRDASDRAYSITGLAQASNLTVYGVTANLSPTAPRSLVTVNLSNARVTLIGSLGLNVDDGPVSDIVFLPNGTLFGRAPRLNRFVTINTNTGLATRLAAECCGQNLDSLAVSPSAVTISGGETPKTYPAGTVFATYGGACGVLAVVDPVTGSVTDAQHLRSNGGFCEFSVSGLRFAPNGTLYTILTQAADPYLGAITPSTGVVSPIGAGLIPPQVGSMAFVTIPPTTPVTGVPAATTYTLVLLFIGLALAARYHFRRQLQS